MAWLQRASLVSLMVSLGASTALAKDQEHESFYEPRWNTEEPRSDIGMPIASFFVPGLDQAWNGQFWSAGIYFGAATAGYTYAGNIWASDHLRQATEEADAEAKKRGDKTDPAGFNQKNNGMRKWTLGGLVAQGAGGMSAFHAFRTAVVTRQPHGQYDFIAHEETPLDVFAAPFHFEFLARPTTFIPLAVGAGVAVLSLQGETPKGMAKDNLSSADGFFSMAYSYNAGTHEEAMFRGWIMPVMREYWGSDFWANFAQACLFSAAHLSTNATPIPQLLLGFDLGYVSQRNGYSIAEGVFIHTWWDVMAFLTTYSYKTVDPETGSRIRPVLWLPPFEMHF